MSTERAWVVGLPVDSSTLGLVGDIQSAASRAIKADPGDRLDIVRFEALATRLEQAALNHQLAPRLQIPVPQGGQTMLLGRDPKSWPTELSDDVRYAANALVAMDLLPVLVVDPHAHGHTEALVTGVADAPAETWVAGDGVFGSRAVESRFRARIAEALSLCPTRRVAISPSGVNNAVVTEILREFVRAEPGTLRVDVPVEYRDGSKSAHAFPLRALPLRDELPPASLELSFALLSIRHTEMDAIVHGAWLRNVEISRPRPAAQTDDLVYDISLRQFEELSRSERHVRMHMYQTGLETAVVGFYRALTDHLLKFPGSVSVQPMYFVTPRKPRGGQAEEHRTSGQVRRGARVRSNSLDRRQRANSLDPGDRPPVSASEPKAVITASSTFRKGTVWTT